MGFLNKLLGKAGDSKSTAPSMEVNKAVLGEKIRQSELFRDLPSKNLDEMVSRMETVRVRSGETIIREGAEGDYYYVLASGTAKVSRRMKEGAEPHVVAELLEPTAFGEEALISNAKRNATVTMSSDGVILRLSKNDFDEYVKEPLVTWLSAAEAQQKIQSGARWIDVRDPEESKSHLHGAIEIPMPDLRERASELNKATLYICYCENGRLSSTAAFLLRQRGYSVGVLRGGLQALKRAGIA